MRVRPEIVEGLVCRGSASTARLTRHRLPPCSPQPCGPHRIRRRLAAGRGEGDLRPRAWAQEESKKLRNPAPKVLPSSCGQAPARTVWKLEEQTHALTHFPGVRRRGLRTMGCAISTGRRSAAAGTRFQIGNTDRRMPCAPRPRRRAEYDGIRWNRGSGLRGCAGF